MVIIEVFVQLVSNKLKKKSTKYLVGHGLKMVHNKQRN